MNSYRDLIVWQRGMNVVEEVYTLIKKLPKDETYVLSDQMRRAAISIPLNIAEGQERDTTKEFVHFLYIARGSKAELETQLELCVMLGFLEENDIKQANEYLVEVGKMINSLIKKLYRDDNKSCENCNSR